MLSTICLEITASSREPWPEPPRRARARPAGGNCNVYHSFINLFSSFLFFKQTNSSLYVCYSFISLISLLLFFKQAFICLYVSYSF